MTERQLSLHEEIIRISDIFQLGLSIEDKDWFYKFKIRMDENGIWKRDSFMLLDFLSKDFVYEFKLFGRLIEYNPVKVLNMVGFNESLNYIPTDYARNNFTLFIRRIKDHLKEEWIEGAIYLFDNSCLSSSDFSYSNREKESAWYYVFESKSISKEFKEKYKCKSIYTDIYDEEGDSNNGKVSAFYDAVKVPIIDGIKNVPPSVRKIQDKIKNKRNKSVWDLVKPMW